jgi:hypothetical protein
MATHDFHHDPALPVLLEAKYGTPLQVNVTMQLQLPNAATWTTFLSIDVTDQVPNQDLTTTLQPVPAGSTVAITSRFSGPQNVGYTARIALSQRGAALGAPIAIDGTTTGANEATVQTIITLS